MLVTTLFMDGVSFVNTSTYMTQVSRYVLISVVYVLFLAAETTC